MRTPTENQWMQGVSTTLVTPTPGSEYVPACKVCKGAGMVYAPRPVYVGERCAGTIDEFVPCPACSVECRTCMDKGVKTYDLLPSDPDYGRLYPCPDCARGVENAERMRRAQLTTAQLSMQYKTMTLESWDKKLSAAQKAGKRLARAAAGLFVEAAGDNFMVALSAIYADAGRALPAQLTDDRRNCLVFQGPVGTGKTGLAAAIVNALSVTHEHKLLYIRVRDLIERVQRTYAKDYTGPASGDVLRDLMTMPILVLDEFNLANPTPDRQEIIETLVRHRYSSVLPTIFTLNSDRDEMEAEWGIRTATAVRAMAHWCPLGGQELRNEGVALEAW